jgi:hypothetical protein
VEDQLQQLEVLRLPDTEELSNVRPWIDYSHCVGTNYVRSKRGTGETGQPCFTKGGKWERIQHKIEQLLEKTAISPLEGIKEEDDFLHDSELTNPNHQKFVDDAIKLWSVKINNYSLRKFYDMYKGKTQTLIFSVSKKYYTLEESVEILDNLLKHQFEDDEQMIKNFLQTLVNVVDKQPDGNPNINVKCNTFLVHSQPSAGKNFFFDCLFSICLNFGQLGSANKHNLFSFQDIAKRRICLWNEPNYESSVTDYLKNMFEGGDTKVRVKNMADAHVKRTPIIILTNNIVNFMCDTAFEDRVVQYKWKPAPFLKNFNLKPYPLAFFELLLKYEIKF